MDHNAGATVPTSTCAKRTARVQALSKFNQLLAGIRKACPEMILQVGGSISFAPESEGGGRAAVDVPSHAGRAEADARPGDDRHQHQPDNVVEQMTAADVAGTSLADPAMTKATAR